PVLPSLSCDVRSIRTFIWAPLRGHGGQKSLTQTRSRARFLTLRRVLRGDKVFATIQALTWITVIGPVWRNGSIFDGRTLAQMMSARVHVATSSHHAGPTELGLQALN